MGIIVTCCCSKKLEAPESAAGRHGRCSECGKTVFIPTSTPKGIIYWSGTDLRLLEAAVHQAVCQLEIADRNAMLDEADKWAKAWKLPPERRPHESGFDLICDMVVSCVQRDAAVGMEKSSVFQVNGEKMVRVGVTRRGRQLLHFIARVGPDQYMCWHHRDAEDEEMESEKQRTDVLQALSVGVHCSMCDYNMGYVRLIARTGLAPIVGYRCSACGRIFCSKCHGGRDQGCPSCGSGKEKLEILAAKIVKKV